MSTQLEIQLERFGEYLDARFKITDIEEVDGSIEQPKPYVFLRTPKGRRRAPQVPAWATVATAAVLVLLTIGATAVFLQEPEQEVTSPTGVTSATTIGETSPTTVPPPTTIVPDTTVVPPNPVIPPDPFKPITIEELRAVFDDSAMWTEDLHESYLNSSFQNLERPEGLESPWLQIESGVAFEAELLDGGAFSTDEIAGRPAVIVAWYGEPESLEPNGGWRQVHQNLAALQAVHESFGDRFGVVSVFIPYGSLPGFAEEREQGREAPQLPDEEFYRAISRQLALNGYTFPVVIDPTTPDGSPMTTWAEFGDGMPTWVLIDGSGSLIDGFHGYMAPIPVTFLLAELEGN